MHPSILTISGHYFDFLHPERSVFGINDIAHGLSNVCRFGGHGKQFYSVAQHSVLASRIVPPEHALAALLHDAPEAFLGDIPSPLKQLLPDYRRIYDHVAEVVFVHLIRQMPAPIDGRQHHPTHSRIHHEAVKRADLVCLATERRDLMPMDAAGETSQWQCLEGVAPLDIIIEPLPPVAARLQFLTRWVELTRTIRPAIPPSTTKKGKTEMKSNENQPPSDKPQEQAGLAAPTGSGHVKHTPAPWKAVQGTDGEPERWLVVADGEMQYHIAVIENGQPGDCCATEGATARLIAAAPELLVALKAIVTHGEPIYPADWVRMKAAGLAALQKASVQNDPAQRAPGSAAYLADDVSIGMVVRWINQEHLNAARETPPNLDYMRAMQRLGESVESALDSYRRATQPPNAEMSHSAGSGAPETPKGN